MANSGTFPAMLDLTQENRDALCLTDLCREENLE
jgi:hypothetical protein